MANQYLANTQPYATPTGQPRTGKTQGQPKGYAMKMFLLMVLFSTPVKEQPHELPGFGPRRADSLEQCLKRKATLEAYIEANKHRDVKFAVFCVEFRAYGYREALENFQRQIGDLS